MKIAAVLTALACCAALAAAEAPPPAKEKVIELEPMRVHENPLISFAIDVTIYADPATNKVMHIIIKRVLPDTDAEQAGLQAGDEIVKLDGLAVNELDARVAPDSPLGRIFLNRDPGEPLKLDVITHRPAKFTLRAQRGMPGPGR